MPKSIKLKLDIKTSADFNFYVPIKRKYVVTGTDAVYNFSSEALTDYTSNVGVLVTNLPPGASSTIYSNPIGRDETSVVSVRTAGVSPGTYFFNIDGSSRLGKTYYVSLDGTDSNDGLSKTTPWQTITKINSLDFTSGDRLLFKGDSTFNGNLFFYNSAGSETDPILISSYDGRAELYAGDGTGIYIKDAGGFDLKKINFQGSGNYSVSYQRGVYFYTDSTSAQKYKHVSIQDCVVAGFTNGVVIAPRTTSNCGYQDIRITDCTAHDNLYVGINISGAGAYGNRTHKNVYISDCTVYNIIGGSNNTGNGILISSVEDGTVEYCETSYCGYGNTGTTGGPEGLWIYSCDNFVFQYCISHHNSGGSANYDGGGIDLDADTNRCTVQYCYAYENQGQGVFLGHFTGTKRNNTVRYNILENNGLRNNYGGIGIFNQAGQVDSSCLIYNNLVYIDSSKVISGTPSCFSLETGVSGDVVDFRVFNNIFIACNGYDFISIPSQTADFSFNNNIYWSPNNLFRYHWGATTYTSLADFNSASGQENLGIQGDPHITNMGQGEKIITPRTLSSLNAYKILSDSSAINRGTNLSTLFGVNTGSVDFYGNVIPRDGTYDIGAHEYYA